MAAQAAPCSIKVFLRHSAHRLVLLGAIKEIFLIAVTHARDHDIERGDYHSLGRATRAEKIGPRAHLFRKLVKFLH